MCTYEISTPLQRAFYFTPKVIYLVTFVIVAYLYANVRNNDPTFDGPETRILRRIFTNVYLHPINSIIVAPSTGCPSGYEAVNFGSWSGLSTGCLCTGGAIYNRSCSSSEAGCVTVDPISGVAISTWRTDKFCITRLTNFTYPGSDGTCETGRTSCGAGLCAESAALCPYTDIRIVASAASPPDSSFTELTLTDTTVKMILSKTVKEEPFIDIKVSFYDSPCMDPLAQYYSHEKTPYYLSVIPENGCSPGGRIDNVEVIDSMTMPALFTENSISASIASQTAYVSYISDENAFLVGLRQYTVRQDMTQCTSINPAIFDELYEYENTFKSSVKGIYIAELSMCCTLFMTIFYEVVVRLRNNENEVKWLKRAYYLNLLLLFLICLLFIISGSFGVRAKVDLNDDLKYLKILSKSQCFQQEVVNRVLQVYQEYIAEFWALVWLSIVLLILSSTELVIALILYLIDCFVVRKRGFGDVKSYYKNIGNSGRRNRPAAGTKQNSSIEMLLNR